MKKFFNLLFKVGNVVIVLIYLMACLIPFLPAGQFWMIAVLGLIFPFLFIAVVIFFIVWLAVRSKWCFLSLFALLIGWQQVSVIAGLNKRAGLQAVKTPETLRVFSWNVSSWSETNKNKFHTTFYLGPMIELIKKQQCDIICLQEFWDLEHRSKEQPITQIFKEMGYPYHYFVRSHFENQEQRMGVVIISKYPIVDSAKFFYGEDHFAEHLIYADIQMETKRIRVFTTHLQSVRFDNEEYVALRRIKRTDQKGLDDSKTIVRKLKNAYRQRSVEADLIQQKIADSPYPVVICGDFNDVPNSYAYFTIKGNLQDAFIEKGRGLGRTYQYLSPTLRIDYILADKQFKVDGFNSLKVPYSDHYPIISDLIFRANQ